MVLHAIAFLASARGLCLAYLLHGWSKKGAKRNNDKSCLTLFQAPTKHFFWTPFHTIPKQKPAKMRMMVSTGKFQYSPLENSANNSRLKLLPNRFAAYFWPAHFSNLKTLANTTGS